MKEDELIKNQKIQAQLLERIEMLELRVSHQEEYIIKLEKALVSVAREAFK